mgnify:CR=1 FL=1
MKKGRVNRTKDKTLLQTITIWRGDDAPSRNVNFSEEYMLQESPRIRERQGQIQFQA